MIHVKVSILITKGIKTMYSFETEKGRRNEKMGGFFNRKMRKKVNEKFMVKGAKWLMKIWDDAQAHQ